MPFGKRQVPDPARAEWIRTKSAQHFAERARQKALRTAAAKAADEEARARAVESETKDTA